MPCSIYICEPKLDVQKSILIYISENTLVHILLCSKIKYELHLLILLSRVLESILDMTNMSLQ